MNSKDFYIIAVGLLFLCIALIGANESGSSKKDPLKDVIRDASKQPAQSATKPEKQLASKKDTLVKKRTSRELKSIRTDVSDLEPAAGHEKKYILVKKKPKHKKIKMEVYEPKMKYKKIKMKIPVKTMKKKKVKGYLVKKEHGHGHGYGHGF